MKKKYSKPNKVHFEDKEQLQAFKSNFDDLKESCQRINRIDGKCAEYREFQDDETDVDSGTAFTFADLAANSYLPWATAEVKRLEKEKMKLAIALMKVHAKK